MKSRLLIFLSIAVFTLTILIVIQSKNLAKNCSKLQVDWPNKCLPLVNTSLPLLELVAKFKPDSTLGAALPIYKEVRFLTNYFNYLMGYERPVSYLILLQNDTEMRANGGFFGSYAIAMIDKGNIDISFQDIYVPDGQIGDGHVTPPKPIDEAFLKGGFYLRDSDWDPDFVQSSKTIRWFFDKGGEINPDMMITISLATIKKIMQVVGPVSIPDYDMELTEDNIFSLLQAKVETDFFPGSTQKRDILTGLGHAFVATIGHLPVDKKIKIFNILWTEAKHKNILTNTTNSNLQDTLEERELTGSLKYPRCSSRDGKCLVDTYMSVEANLGANKANCCTTTKTVHKIAANDELVTHDVEITYTNSSTDENPKLPDFFGGNYINYVRFYIPKESINLSVEAEPTLPTTLPYYPEPFTGDPARLDVNDFYLFKILGMFHITRAGTTSRIHFSYDLPITGQNYELHILKQHGMQSSPQEIIYGGKSQTTTLEDDYVFSSVK